MQMNKIALAITSMLLSGGALAHGYISEPASRDLMCRDAKTPNINCGQAQYEPQSAGEGPDGFPAKGPRDGELASASGTSNWIATALNAQSSDRWVKHKVESGPLDITWTFTAAHPIADFKYYITKSDWNPNQVLTRDSFELTPFCTIPGGPAVSNGKTTHTCNLPERSGYQIIYGAWDVSDTASTFYKVIDVEYDEVASVWKHNIGSILPSRILEAGDRVKVRLFDAKGEREDLNVTLNIDSSEAGEPNQWAMALANKLNAKHQNIRAGVKNKDGEVVPVAGTNAIYTLADSNILRAEIEVTAHADNRPGITLSNVKDRYPLNEGENRIEFDVKVIGEMTLSAKVYNDKQENVGFGSASASDNVVTLSVNLWNAKEGTYNVVVEGKMQDGNTVQQSFETRLEAETAGDYDFIFPEGIDKYAAGTKVLQPKTKQVFECKPFPYSGWCKIYNAHSTHYEPGTGSNWQDAWTAISGTHNH